MDVRRLTPRTDAILADPRLVAAVRRLGRPIVLSAVRDAQDRARGGEIDPSTVADIAAHPIAADVAGGHVHHH